MIRKRFPTMRTTRIAAWTTVAVAWAIALIGRQMEVPGVEETSPAPETAVAVAPEPNATTTMPTMPEDGLVVIRYTPAPPPPPVVQQVVVQRAAPSPAVSTSQGS